jgi:hypothetical protein
MKAFPNDETNVYGEFTNKGMDLRDYFAAQAIQAVISVAKGSEIGIDNGAITEDTHRAARCAYAVADAMMEARK